MHTFQKVTGPKTDQWLVKTVGVLVTVIGAALVSAGLRRQSPIEVPLLGIGSAAGLTGIDVIYNVKHRISRVYLIDAIAELALLILWAFVRRRGKRVTLLGEALRTKDATEAELEALGEVSR
jgi:hypothetical protein